MRTIATEENIRQACRVLAEEGRKCTVQNVRALIGGGSYSTIVNLMQDVNAKDDFVSKTSKPDDEQFIQEQAAHLINDVYDKCRKVVAEEGLNKIAIIEARLQKIEDDLIEKNRKISELEQKILELQQK